MSNSHDTLQRDKVDFRVECERRVHGRRVGVTRAGRFGISPADAKEGDRVCVVRGAVYPFVVRKKDYGTEGGGGFGSCLGLHSFGILTEKGGKGWEVEAAEGGIRRSWKTAGG
jgi:hypothetical protein